ncbi:MAG TPA: FlgD immunoglobulin-like domain containing protein [Candidatus Krumholzibacteria bacterium]|nr:FlgD immunoglobulin-like domain containing protein [Candidatus Krumholzibacteria bacterium]
MNNRTVFITTLLLLDAAVCRAGTFVPAPYLPRDHVDVLTRQVANDEFSRNLMGAPYATVVVGHVDVYDKFPYLESRYFQFVSDPAWNRVLMGEMGAGVDAYDGAGGKFGKLNDPRGLATDGRARIFIADTGNDRVLAFRVVTEYDHVTLDPLFTVEGLARPYGVAFSDGGTALDTNDDHLYIANTGRNEVRAYDLNDRGARFVHATGDLGSGVGRFAGPMAITVGRENGANTADVYVADAHNGRIVRLHDDGTSFAWAAEKKDLGLVTSLDTDAWGNLYAAAPQSGSVMKLSPSLDALAGYSNGIERPRDFHVVFEDVRDHRNGSERVSGRGNGVLVEDWNGQHGIRMLNLGVDISSARAGTQSASFTVGITDRAMVTADLVDPASGEVIARHDAGVLDAGAHTVAFAADDYTSTYKAGEYRAVVHARSTYEHGDQATADVTVKLASGGAPALPSRLTLLGNSPNPFNPETTIRFIVPAGARRDYSVRIYDVAGRLVRELASGKIDAGAHDVRWDGSDDHGATVSSGVYLYRVSAGNETQHGKMVLLK